MAKRGERLPQDRLNAGMFAFWVVIPFFMLLQGWGLECDDCSTAMGGLALPVVTSFCTAAGLLAAFASLNTYCAGKCYVLTLYHRRLTVYRGKTKGTPRGDCREIPGPVFLLRDIDCVDCSSD